MLKRFHFAWVSALAVLFIAVPPLQAQALTQFDLPSQSLAAALRAIGSQTGTNVLFDPPLVEGLEAPALKAQLTLNEAFARVLEGSGLSHRFLDDKTVVIAASPVTSDSFTGDGLDLQAQTTHEDVELITVFGRRLGNVPGATGTKTGTSLLETPFTVNVVSRELLDLRSVSNIGEAIETVSGVTRTIGFSGNQRYRIRAFQAISYLRDGFRQSISQPEVDLQGVESVETLKGPASALYGRFEPGGVINFVSKRPRPEFGADLFVTGGAYDYGRVGLDLTGALHDEAVLGRLNVAYENSESFRDLIDNEQFFIAPVLEYRPDAATSLIARVEYLTRDMAFDRGLGNHPIFLTVPISRNYGEDFMRLRKEQWSGALEFNRRINDAWRYRLGAYYSHVDVPEEEFFNYGFPALSGTTVNRNFSSFKELQEDSVVQAELYGDIDTGAVSHRLLMGVEYTNDNLEFIDAQAVFGAPGVDLYNPATTGRPDPASYFFEGDSVFELSSKALYVQDEIAWERWRLLLGGRYEQTRTETFDESYVNPGVTREDNPFSPRAGVTFLARPNLSFYASWARSFRNEGSGGLLESNLIPKPTRGEQGELGAKFYFMDNRIEASLAAFDLTKTNVIVGDPDDFTLVIQSGELVSRGLEAEISARPLDSWTLVGSYGYADAKITKDSNAFIVGNRMAGVPTHQASFWTSWVFAQGALRGLTLGGGAFYASEQAATTTNNYYLPSYVRIDLNAAYAFGNGYELRANLDNVTDERIYMTGGFSQIYPQAPRSARVTISKRWR